MALRHPTFGNYSDEELAYRYFNGHNTNYYRYNGSTFDGLIWLLSDDSSWLPERLRKVLINGTKQRDTWIQQIKPRDNSFYTAIYHAHENEFQFSIKVQEGLFELIVKAIENLSIKDRPERILQRILEEKMIESYLAYLQETEARRISRSKKKEN